MKTKKTPQKFLTASLMLAASLSLQAADFYWGSDTTADNTSQSLTSWQEASHWFTDLAGTSAAPNAPLAGDNVTFSITSLNGIQLLPRLYAETTINSITLNNTVQFDLQGGSANRLLHFGAGGLIMNGTANATIGTATSSRNILVRFQANQTWTNTSTGTINIRNSAASSNDAGNVVVTFNAASTGAISNSGAFSDGTNSTFGIIVDSEGSGNVGMAGSTYSGGTLVKRGLLSSSGHIGTSTVLLGDTIGSNDARINLTGISASNIVVQANAGSGLTALTGSGSGDYQGTISMNRDLSIGSVSGSGTTVAYSGAISGVGNLTIGRVATGTANPTVTISNADNSYTGKTTIESATVIVNKLSNAGFDSNLGAASGANSVITMSTVSTSTLRYIGTGDTTNRDIEIAASTTLEQAGEGHLVFAGNLNSINTGNRTLTLRGATEGTAEIGGMINNIGGGSNTTVTKMDSGEWRLTGANTYAGATAIQNGTLVVSSLNSVTGGSASSNLGAPTTVATGTIAMGSGATTGQLNYVGGGETSDRVINLSGTTGGAVLDASGAGALILTANATASGGGIKTLTLQGTNTGNNTITRVVNNNATNVTSVAKEGVGTWVMAGTNTYTGATTINGGRLIVSGSLASGSAVAVNDGGTLAGTGTVFGAVTVNSGGTLSPGNSPGLQTLGSLVLNDGGHYNWQILDATGVAGTGYDSYTLTGTLDLSELTGAAKFNINLWSLESIGPDVNGDALNFDNAVDQSWTLIATDSTITGFNASLFAVNVGAFNGTGGFSNALDGGSFSVGLGNNNTDLVLNYTAIPEPSALILFGIALGSLVAFRRRKH